MKPLTRLYIVLLSVILSAIISGCQSDTPRPAPENTTPRTVLVYMIANNNLGYASAHFDLNDIAEMEIAARNGALGTSRLIVFHHSYTDAASPRLIEITAQGQKVLKTYTLDKTSASEEVMNRVIADTKQFAPARKYGIILWSHASGWWNTGVDLHAKSPRSFGYDNSPSNTMSITSLKNVLTGKDFDFIYFDCCFMATVEVAYELRKCAEWMIASSAELPANGTPYHLVLPYLMKEGADCSQAARTTFEYYNDRYNPSASPRENPDAFGCTFSALYLPNMERLAECIKGIYASKKYPVTEYATIQQFAPQTGRWDYCDLDDFICHMDGIKGVAGEWSSYDWFESALSDVVRGHGSTPGIHLQNTFTVNSHCGLTTFVPRSPDDFDRYNYRALAWYRVVASHMF